MPLVIKFWGHHNLSVHFQRLDFAAPGPFMPEAKLPTFKGSFSEGLSDTNSRILYPKFLLIVLSAAFVFNFRPASTVLRAYSLAPALRDHS